MPASDYVTRIRPDQAKLWQHARPLLGRLDMELTERCNNRCIHCYINRPATDRAAKRQELTTDEVKAILKEGAALGALSVRLTGGEPMLREDFEAIYVYARRLGLAVTVATNATLLTPALADLFARMPPREEVEVSVYGMTRVSYEAVTRAPGSFEAEQRGLRLLQERKIPFLVKGLRLPPTRHETDALVDWAREATGSKERPSISTVLELRCRRDSEAKNRRIRRLRPSAEQVMTDLCRERDAYIREMREFCARFLAIPGDRLFLCRSGHSPCVDAYGKCQLCLFLRHPATVYDLRGGSIREAITSFFPALQKKTATNPDYLRRCARCFLRGLCEQCPARSWMEHGALDTPVEYLCDLTHAQARFLGMLKDGEQSWHIEDWKARVRRFVQSP